MGIAFIVAAIVFLLITDGESANLDKTKGSWKGNQSELEEFQNLPYNIRRDLKSFELNNAECSANLSIHTLILSLQNCSSLEEINLIGVSLTGEHRFVPINSRLYLPHLKEYRVTLCLPLDLTEITSKILFFKIKPKKWLDLSNIIDSGINIAIGHKSTEYKEEGPNFIVNHTTGEFLVNIVDWPYGMLHNFDFTTNDFLRTLKRMELTKLTLEKQGVTPLDPSLIQGNLTYLNLQMNEFQEPYDYSEIVKRNPELKQLHLQPGFYLVYDGIPRPVLKLRAIPKTVKILSIASFQIDFEGATLPNVEKLFLDDICNSSIADEVSKVFPNLMKIGVSEFSCEDEGKTQSLLLLKILQIPSMNWIWMSNVKKGVHKEVDEFLETHKLPDKSFLWKKINGTWERFEEGKTVSSILNSLFT